jgi:hypothetical protein
VWPQVDQKLFERGFNKRCRTFLEEAGLVEGGVAAAQVIDSKKLIDQCEYLQDVRVLELVALHNLNA